MSMAKMSSFYNQQGRENLNFWVPERQITKSQINLNMSSRDKAVKQYKYYLS